MIDQDEMVETIRHYGIKNRLVLDTTSKVDRKLFVPEKFRDMAYLDSPVFIGFGQTASQPYTIARMIELAIDGWTKTKLKRSIALEIGTGSGWQTTILAKIFKTVYTIEKIPQLANRARKVIYDLGFKNVGIKIGDGKSGWPGHAPYHAIIVSADADKVPQELIDQLIERGRIVIPVKGEMLRGTKTNSQMKWQSFGQYLFVPLV